MLGPYGSWRSPVTPELIVAKSVGLSQACLDGDDIYWLENRPTEGGRSVIVRHAPDGSRVDITPPDFNTRTRVHEYGGGAYTVHAGIVFFCNDADQRVYRLDPGSAPIPLTPAGQGLRFADLTVDSRRKRLIAVCERHSGEDSEPENSLVAFPWQAPADAGIETLVAGHDFFSSPQLDHSSDTLAWISWDHPNMPWDASDLWTATLGTSGQPGTVRHVAGGDQESVFQPRWSTAGLVYVSDRSDWWNLYRWDGQQSHPLHAMAAEFGLPQWVFGMTTYAIAGEQSLVCTCLSKGIWQAAELRLDSGAYTPLPLEYTDFDSVQANRQHAVFVAGAPDKATRVVRVDLASGAATTLRTSIDLSIDAGFLSAPEPVSYSSGPDGAVAHALFYAPRNREYTAPPGTLPPVLVRIHGGPTAATGTALNLSIQFWTSRGFAVLDVNYRGSTGYGRNYRNQLNGAWGIADVEDCEYGVRYLAGSGRVDSARAAIHGSSAGGYTTLCALTFGDTFHAGASLYGISDLEALVNDTHKFESRYLDKLVGPWPAARATYYERSPIHYTDRLSVPAILLQGLEDKVVPPSQAEKMVTALRERGLPVAYVTFAGEQHGFRQAATIKRALEAELYFYSRVFDFELAEPVEPITIDNL